MRWTVFLNAVLLFVVLFYVYPLRFLTTALVGELGSMRARNVSGLQRTSTAGS